MELKRDTLVIMCSRPQDMNKVLDFIQNDLGLGKPGITFDLLSVPGCIHSLNSANSIKFFDYLKALSGWISFLVEKHDDIKRIVIIDHPNCAWFKELVELRYDKRILEERLNESQSKEFIKLSDVLKINTNHYKTVKTVFEVYEMNISENDETEFKKVEI